MDQVDVVIVGGGVAGLAAALTLGRARRSVVVIDAGHPRNEPAGHSHGFLTRDGSNPLELTAIGRAEAAGYGVEIVEATVTSVEREETGGFRVESSDGSVRAGRRLLVTAGLVDVLPEVPGVAERWGKDVVHCPFCFGREVRDKPVGILATGPVAIHQAMLWRQWTADLVVFRHTAPEFAAEDLARLDKQDIGVVDGEVVALDIGTGGLDGVRLDSGETVGREVLVIAPRFEARHELIDDLGAEVAELPQGNGHQVVADAMGKTAVPGLWVAGNTANPMLGVLQSAASGTTAAMAIHFDLIDA